jgi:hypothetical protein
MDDLRTYRIEVGGQIDQDDLNAGSPLPVVVKRIEADATRMRVRTDQSGLIGLLRHLHTRGITLIKITTHPFPAPLHFKISENGEERDG